MFGGVVLATELGGLAHQCGTRWRGMSVESIGGVVTENPLGDQVLISPKVMLHALSPEILASQSKR